MFPSSPKHYKLYLVHWYTYYIDILVEFVVTLVDKDKVLDLSLKNFHKNYKLYFNILHWYPNFICVLNRWFIV